MAQHTWREPESSETKWRTYRRAAAWLVWGGVAQFLALQLIISRSIFSIGRGAEIVAPTWSAAWGVVSVAALLLARLVRWFSNHGRDRSD